MSPAADLPLTFEPLFVERVWGGRRLETLLGKQLPPGQPIGESWELVDRPEAQSVVRQGPWRGRTLHELWREHRAEIFGTEMPDTPRFPILAKLLDSQENMSVQVHPGAEASAQLGGECKTEMWYFLASDNGAEVHVGLRPGTTRADLEKAARSEAVISLLHRVPVRPGDAIFVPSGRPHAIGAGTFLVEIQQNSDTTYRLFDWNRGGPSSSARPLQIEAALQSTNFADFHNGIVRPSGETLVECPLFLVEKWDLRSARPASARPSFALFVCLTGAVEVGGIQIAPGEFFLVPAGAAGLELRPVAPSTSLLRITHPGR